MNTADTNTAAVKSGHIYMIATTAVMTAAICILAPFSVPVGPVPITLATLMICLAVYVLGAKAGIISVCLYLLMGLIGLPVFSGFSGGFTKLAGPTGGYLIGYIPMVAVIGLFTDKISRRDIASPASRKISNLMINRIIQFAGIVLGTAVLYTLGTAWFCYVMDCDLAYALGLCVIPFIPGDIAKTIAAVAIGPVLRERLRHIRQ